MVLTGVGGAGRSVAAGSAAAVPAVPDLPVSAGSIPGHFTLQTLDGHEVSDETYRGRWMLIYFGYTYCPDVCPTVLIRMGQALDALGPLASRVQPVFITVDPTRDTAPHLVKYLAAFSPKIVGLRGDPDQIQSAAKQFHVYYRARSLGNGQYSVDHSSYLYVMAPDGHFARLLADSLTADQLADELRKLAGQAP
jgi:protein SCO1/2